MEYHLYIKNMVCNRCIKVVREELEKLSVNVKDIRLGEVIINSPNEPNMTKIKEVLEENGFELLEDKKIKLVEKIKTLLIDQIHHHEGELEVNYSEFLSKEIGKDYHTLSNLFSSIENLTIEKFIILQKIEKVKEYLIYNELTLSELAYKLGYSSVAHLSNQFKQITGFSPSEFKKLKTHQRKPLDGIS
ncbi:AraC family transcriptional regulator [Sporocytophaga myxococcoides]|uniref:AraC family transcriptional regulator n=1 Tax=Sporocytophaga myxococcoides TaxID=153721 RepID=A0A098LK16_9BACT|nr:helix-turn-helix domain-containing protein [Sporocytophaga myxococcoides]GAL86533.1 AraC family transcriptional regulator [Sporocytophaga myxococcoides]